MRLFRTRVNGTDEQYVNPLATEDGMPGYAVQWLEVEGPFFDDPAAARATGCCSATCRCVPSQDADSAACRSKSARLRRRGATGPRVREAPKGFGGGGLSAEAPARA